MKKCNIFVAAGSKTPNDENLVEEAKWLGAYLAENGYTYVQGGSKHGLMGATYNEFIKKSDKVILHIWEVFVEKDLNQFAGKTNIHKSLNDRLTGFISDTDVLIVLPGGNGTLQEFATFFEYCRVKNNDYKIIIVNYDGFYDDFIEFQVKQIKFGFDQDYKFFKYVHVVKNVKEAVKLLPNITKKMN